MVWLYITGIQVITPKQINRLPPFSRFSQQPSHISQQPVCLQNQSSTRQHVSELAAAATACQDSSSSSPNQNATMAGGGEAAAAHGGEHIPPSDSVLFILVCVQRRRAHQAGTEMDQGSLHSHAAGEQGGAPGSAATGCGCLCRVDAVCLSGASFGGCGQPQRIGSHPHCSCAFTLTQVPPAAATPAASTLCWLQLVGLGIGFLQLAHPPTQAFTNTLKLWLVGNPLAEPRLQQLAPNHTPQPGAAANQPAVAATSASAGSSVDACWLRIKHDS